MIAGSLAVASWSTLQACASTGATQAANGVAGAGASEVVAQCSPRDPHAEPLTLLPPDAVGWGRVETARARASRHWGPVTAILTNNGMMDTVNRFQRELGFDLLGATTRLAGAIYERPTSPEQIPRAALVVFEGFDPARVRQALARGGQPVREHTVRSLTVYSNRDYAVSFLAPDVLVAFHPGVADQVERQLCGTERRTLDEDPRYVPLWTRAGGRRPSLAQSAGANTDSVDVDTGESTMRVPGFSRAIAWVDGEDALSVRAVGETASASEASAFVGAAERLRREYGGRFLVRLMGFGRLLNDGIALSNEGAFVRVAIDATGTEVTRALQAASAGSAMR
jgi:hypothetical protein